jgi:hypothetical protein
VSSDYYAYLAGEMADEGATAAPACRVDGETIDTYGGEHYWHCDRPGTVDVEGTFMCEDHAGERGYGPRQEEYGFDPDDGLNPTAATTAGEDGTP